ncbi:hypothetical protein NDU88_000889 [Pleurodeles waltl]|uniref:Uncharacterized protein n=1 Tax=Pleurodeles waltl TaxID=8319 RepID=A0AAV7S8V2_PLEWA|nr:hypothetical protein NDU88_000889 [Pleurodeles waltl]
MEGGSRLGEPELTAASPPLLPLPRYNGRRRLQRLSHSYRRVGLPGSQGEDAKELARRGLEPHAAPQ